MLSLCTNKLIDIKALEFTLKNFYRENGEIGEFPSNSNEWKVALDKIGDKSVAHLVEQLIIEKTFLQKIGSFFAFGTSCPCCLGYRILFALIIGFLTGVYFG